MFKKLKMVLTGRAVAAQVYRECSGRFKLIDEFGLIEQLGACEYERVDNAPVSYGYYARYFPGLDMRLYITAGNVSLAIVGDKDMMAKLPDNFLVIKTEDGIVLEQTKPGMIDPHIKSYAPNRKGRLYLLTDQMPKETSFKCWKPIAYSGEVESIESLLVNARCAVQRKADLLYVHKSDCGNVYSGVPVENFNKMWVMLPHQRELLNLLKGK